MTELDSFVHNGLLGNPINVEATLREGPTQAMEMESMFVANGLLSDVDGDLLDDGIQIDDDSKSQEETREYN